MFQSIGMRNEDGSAQQCRRTPVTHVDTSHFLSSSSTPVATKTVDVQTVSFSEMAVIRQSSASPKGPTQSSALEPIGSVLSQQFSVRQQQQLAKFIESEMKEKYMEQARTLEQFQVLMKKDLLDKQAQLMQQIQRGLDVMPGLANGSDSSKPGVCAKAYVGNSVVHNGVTDSVAGAAVKSTVISTSLGSPISASPDSQILHNGFTPLHNGAANGQTEHPVTSHNAAATSSSFSADESLNGNTSQESSSHETWDSTNAFTHERPVLTGSERSTPTPALQTSTTGGSNHDLELLSQSIHIPVKDSELDVNSVLDRIAEVGSVDNVPSISPVSVPTADDSTPRLPLPSTAATSSVDSPMISVPEPLCNGTDEKERSLTADDEIHYSSSSTPPPESPADDLSASLRYSLREKHSRHLADMKAYYEQELSHLKDTLASSLDITKHEAYLGLQTRNDKLRERCKVLEEELIRANRYINSVDKQMEELESSFSASLVTNKAKFQTDSMEGDDSKSFQDEQLYNKLTQAEARIQSLEAKNNDLLTALCDAYEVKDTTSRTASHTHSLYNEVKQKYEDLKLSHDLTQAKLESAECRLKEAHKELSVLETAISRLRTEHQKLAKENEVLRLSSAASLRNGSYSKLQSSTEEHEASPLLKAEKRLEATVSSPNKHRGRHHHCRSDKARHHSRHRQSTSLQAPSSDNSSGACNPDLSNQLSPQPLSDATQSSDNSSRDYSKARHRSSHRKSSHGISTEQREAADHQNFYQDDLISAYSPLVDRQRHSSSASSGGPAVRSATSPSRQSVERPYGFHHVGASISPSKRTQQWAIRSPFKRSSGIKETLHHNVSPSAAKKNLSFTLNRSLSTSPQKPKMDKEEILEKVRSGKVYSEEFEKSPTVVSRQKPSAAHNDRQKLVKDAETRLDELLAEKRQLESSLTRMSTSHNRKDKQKEENIEQQLDKVDKDLGSVRMTLRRYNAL